MDVKYLSSVCDGGEPEVKALQKAWAVDRMSSPFALESVIFGEEGSVQSDLLRPCDYNRDDLLFGYYRINSGLELSLAVNRVWRFPASGF